MNKFRQEDSHQPLFIFTLLVTGVGLVALLGFVIFLLYIRFPFSPTAPFGLWLLAIVAGLASLFSPCSFPLLLTLLNREADSRSYYDTLQILLPFATGIVLFLLGIGLLLAAGAGGLVTRISFTSPAGRLLRLLTGSIIIVIGLWQFRGRSLNFSWLDRLLYPLWDIQYQLRKQSSTLGYGLYGFGYILTGFGWTGPILAGLAIFALAVGNAFTALSAFLVATLTIVTVIAVLFMVIATALSKLLTPLRHAGQPIKRWSSVLLIIIGCWLVAISIWSVNIADLFQF